MSLRIRRTAVPVPLLVVLGVAGCGEIPKDPADTLERVRREGVLRAGVSASPPWVRLAGEGSAGEPTGAEPEAIRAFAASLGARVEWHAAGAGENLGRLERGELDVVAAGLTMSSPWVGRVSMTRPYAGQGGERRVLAVRPGENGLLVALERFLHAHPPRAPQRPQPPQPGAAGDSASAQ